MENHHFRAKALLKKYLEGECNEQEKTLIEEWYLAIQDNNYLLKDEEIITDLSVLEQRLSEIPQRKSLRIKRIATVAAVILIFLTIGILWNRIATNNINTDITIINHDILPGGDRATLSLEGEEDISLSSLQKGLVTTDTSIIYPDGTTVRQIEDIKMATLSTPVAGQYQITLPDGTKAWLNALSSIRYPTSFRDKERRVSITGEVYFEVAKDPKHPFILHTKDQEIEVLGTSFNVNTYKDNGQILTTLTEGSLRVTDNKFHNKVVLKPGQQSIVTDSEVIVVKQVDTEEISSWKDGLYIISNEPLLQYTKKIERWYDVKIDIQQQGNKHLSAIIPRDAKLSEVLQAITLKTGVKFKIEGRRVTAM